VDDNERANTGSRSSHRQERVDLALSEQTSATRPDGRIIVGIDDSPGGLAALHWAVHWARSRRVELVAVRAWALGLPRHGGRRRHVARIHPHIVMYWNGVEQREASADLVRRSFLTVAGGMPEDVDVCVRTPEGDPGEVLTRIARAGSDLLVVGQDQAHRLRHALHGSVSHYCCEHAPCPVVVVPEG
jgi:nucleotide-binding universal stress UspA family protein